MAEREPNRLRDDRYAALETALSACQEELAQHQAIQAELVNQRDEAVRKLSPCREALKWAEDSERKFALAADSAETALSACQEELARVREKARRAEMGVTAMEDDLDHKRDELETAEAARDELARLIREHRDTLDDAARVDPSLDRDDADSKLYNAVSALSSEATKGGAE